MRDVEIVRLLTHSVLLLTLNPSLPAFHGREWSQECRLLGGLTLSFDLEWLGHS